MLESGAELVTHCSFLLPYFYPTNLLEKMAKDISLDLRKEAEAAGEHVDEEHENDVVHEVVNRHGDARPDGNSQLPGLVDSHTSLIPDPSPLPGPMAAAVTSEAETMTNQKTKD
ncbi:hypothetical protein PI125_g21188 [Phytophthora idaei]|nr:hypothetical protein PI125_g21188 [Phytophthora idaei]KAG3132714.1 hypothetical protein PI126_g19517 [Phytophthora idaei]